MMGRWFHAERLTAGACGTVTSVEHISSGRVGFQRRVCLAGGRIFQRAVSAFEVREVRISMVVPNKPRYRAVVGTIFIFNMMSQVGEGIAGVYSLITSPSVP